MYMNTDAVSIDYKSNLTHYLQDYVYYYYVPLTNLSESNNIFNIFPEVDTLFFESDNIFYLSSYSFMLIPPPTSFIFCVVLAIEASDSSNINIKVNNDYLTGLLNISENTVTYETQLHPSQDYVIEFEIKDINFVFASEACGVSISFK